ncbi:hypothetical protein SCLCIDRAFT_1207912, partial [Scleroderma citrinum Foug A]
MVANVSRTLLRKTTHSVFGNKNLKPSHRGSQRGLGRCLLHIHAGAPEEKWVHYPYNLIEMSLLFPPEFCGKTLAYKVR